ncbi:hypothetical protein [Mesorhizobium sp. M1406]|uniref:hypothetical protein n=1 Tax=Mesorhizobium sp. M1406 TaxID=2957099 RepID=UPI00333B201E
MVVTKSPIAKLFEERISHHASRGLHGREIFEALAIDDALPGLFEAEDVANILGIQTDSLKRRRKDGEPPEFIRVGGRLVKYPKPAFCLMLAAGYRSVAA